MLMQKNALILRLKGYQIELQSSRSSIANQYKDLYFTT